ncbi:Ovalbumin-related protein Y, partial [Eufriesea mexicana]
IPGITETKDARNEIVRATKIDRLPASVPINLFRLPPSPANLLKPDGFQFYTYNERGDMITRQMTMQEIQALIASGGPDHSNVEIHEPQKAEDILTGGKKVMDVVEKVQNVLKSALGKPLSTLTGSHPTIPEKVNVEWSNILPAILAGDKYGNKIEETHYVETQTSKVTSMFTAQNDSFIDLLKSNISETVPLKELEDIVKYTEENEEVIMHSAKNETQDSLSAITPETTTVSYTEKLMIPVPVIITEQNSELITQYTTSSPILYKMTEVTVSLENATYDYQNHDNNNLTFINAVTNPTTKSNYDNTSFINEPLDVKDNCSSVEEVTDSIDSLKMQTKVKPTTDTLTDNAKIPSNMQTSSMLDLNEVETLVANEPFTMLPLQSSVSFPTVSINKYGTTILTESSTIVHDAVTKLSNIVPTQPLKPSSMELVINSLSNVISQVSEQVPPALPISSVFESIPSKNDAEIYNGSKITISTIPTTTHPSITREDWLGNTNDTFAERIQVSPTETTVKFKVDQEKISSITSPVPVITTNMADMEKMTNYSDISIKYDTTHTVSNGQLDLNVTKATTKINETVNDFNPLQPIAIIHGILHTASTETNTIATETLTLPNDLSENVLPNTLASSLIAGFELSSPNKIQNVFNNATTSFPYRVNLTDITTNSKLNLSNIVVGNISNREKEDFMNENEIQRTSTTKEDVLTEISSKDVITLKTTDRMVLESSQSQNDQLTVTLEPTSVSFSVINATVKNTVTNEIGVSLVNNTYIEHTFNPTYEIVISSNESSKNANITIPTIPTLEKDPQVVLQSNDKTSTIHLDDTTEISFSELDKQNLYHTVTISDEVSTNTSESVTVIPYSSNAEEQSAQKQHQNHDIPVKLSNSTNAVTPSFAKETGQQRKNGTDHISSITVTSFNDEKPFVAVPQWNATSNVQRISLEDGIRHSSNTTTTLNSITKESNEVKGIISATINSIDWDRLENKTKRPSESYESNVGNLTSPSKINNTGINSQQIWQRISLHPITPLNPVSTEVNPIAGTIEHSEISKHPEAPTVSTMLETNATEMKTHFQLPPTNKLTEAELTVPLDGSKSIGGLDTSTRNASIDIVNFSRFCNELAIKFWIAANNGLSIGRSFVLSPFGMISLLAMIFLGARGSTSDQMNEVLGLDNVATFNPHLIFQNVTDTVSLARHQGIVNAAFVRELFADKAKVRRLLPFYKEQAQQFYEGLVAEVNFATISDLARRRTNLLIRKQTGGRIKDFVKSNTVPLRSPLAAISANVFQTDCNTSLISATGRDGELYFAVSSAHRLRKLIPVPATVWRSNVLAGYEPSLDATAIALGGIDKLVSTIFLVPGQQGHAAPGDTLDRLEHRLVKGNFQDGSWDKLLKVLIPRTGLELQIPKFSHRSIINATAALKRMGLDQLFSSHADFKGINGIGNRLFLSDVLQMNLFSTCGDENIANGRHHVEIYPASPTLRNSHHEASNAEQLTSNKMIPIVDSWSKSYRAIPFKEMGRNVEKSEDKSRLKLDQPFLYFVRHNPTGLILHIGRFNPRLL